MSTDMTLKTNKFLSNSLRLVSLGFTYAMAGRTDECHVCISHAINKRQVVPPTRTQTKYVNVCEMLFN